MEVRGIGDQEIATIMSITVVRVNQIKSTPEYLAIRAQLFTGYVADINLGVKKTTEDFVEEMEDLVPAALVALRDTLAQKANPNLRLKAATEILDRNSQLGKISRVNVTKTSDFNFDDVDHLTRAFTDAFQAAGVTPVVTVTEPAQRAELRNCDSLEGVEGKETVEEGEAVDPLVAAFSQDGAAATKEVI
jgi:hypothetical protein